MFGQVVVFVDFLVNYADPKFVDEVDLMKIKPASTHYIGQKETECRIPPWQDGGLGNLTR
jgi:hypothetical protein